MIWLKILQDALFAAIAATGFAAISQPPRRAFIYCALIAAIAHSVRFLLMNPDFGIQLHITVATAIASFIVGCLAVFLSPFSRMPAETCLYPALLPMIPGIYAYKCFGALALCVLENNETLFQHHLFQFASNGMICLVVLLVMVIGATLPTLIFGKIAFQATRHNDKTL